jgi:hypothetical protein
LGYNYPETVLENLLITTLSQSVMITVFVLFMMVVIEYINIQSKNIWSEKLRRSPIMQIITAATLGIIPGCLGSFTVVSLYTHKMMGLSALVAVMIATSGDEAFVMFALFPGKALLLNMILFVIAILTGWLVHLFNRKNFEPEQHGFLVHDQEYCKCFSKKTILPQLKKMTFERALLLLLMVIFITLLLTGVIGSQAWDWKRITFMIGSLFMLFIFVTVPEHFLQEHLYRHILRKHLLRIFMWTWGAFVVLHFIETSLTLTNLVQNNMYLVLLFAVLLGIIPESGPHLVFVTMFSENLIPFSVLLANSIVQDGHGMLPLLAESRKDFLRVKAINLLMGFMIGLIFMIIGI